LDSAQGVLGTEIPSEVQGRSCPRYG